jgi:hypothetical protein
MPKSNVITIKRADDHPIGEERFQGLEFAWIKRHRGNTGEQSQRATYG